MKYFKIMALVAILFVTTAAVSYAGPGDWRLEIRNEDDTAFQPMTAPAAATSSPRVLGGSTHSEYARWYYFSDLFDVYASNDEKYPYPGYVIEYKLADHPTISQIFGIIDGYDIELGNIDYEFDAVWSEIGTMSTSTYSPSENPSISDTATNAAVDAPTNAATDAATNADTNASTNLTADSVTILGISVPTNASYISLVNAHNSLATKYNATAGKYNAAAAKYNDAAGKLNSAASKYNAAAAKYNDAAAKINLIIDALEDNGILESA